MSIKSVIVVGLLVTVPGISAAQPVTDAAAVPRTPWGDPDLQGQWTNTTTTPMQRPEDLSDQETLTGEALAVRDEEVAAAVSFDNPPGPGSVGGYNEFWVERGRLIPQTSLIVDPPDGRLPALTPKAQRKVDAYIARWVAPPTSWEDMNLYDRCLTRGLPGAMIPGFYNHNYLILQTPDYVVLQVEMIGRATCWSSRRRTSRTRPSKERPSDRFSSRFQAANTRALSNASSALTPIRSTTASRSPIPRWTRGPGRPRFR